MVIGAGASVDVGFPTGETLKDTLAQKLMISSSGSRLISGDPDLAEAATFLTATSGGGNNNYRRAARRIAEAMPLASSIDNYLDAHAGDKSTEMMGKLAIAVSILEAEAQSPLSTKNGKRIEHGALKSTWYAALAKRLFEGVSLNDVDRVLDNVTFVIFNYDRCVEVFLHAALQTYYGIGESRAAEIINKARFYHPYGVVGRLPWQDSLDDTAKGAEVPFGAELDYRGLIQVAEGIKTFTERNLEAGFLASVRKACAEATTMVYLGFAFGDQNMELLSISSLTPEHSQAARVYATVYRISDPDQHQIKASINSALSPPTFSFSINLLNGTCIQLFDHFSRSITA